MKKLTKTQVFIVFAFIFTICFGFYLTKDEPLNPEAAQWIAEASRFKENDAYYLLLGLSAKDDPIVAGKKVYQLYKDKPPLWDPNEEPNEVKEKERLALPEQEGLFCSMKELNCWSYIFANTDKIQAAVQPYPVIKERYLRFIQSKDYHTNLISVSAMPSFQFLTKGNQIVLLQAIDQAQTDPQCAIKNIQTDLTNLRQQLEVADYLLLKLIINAMVARDIQAITLLEQKYGVSAPIARLTPEEKSLDKSFKFELAYQRHTMAQIDNSIEPRSLFEQWMYQLKLYFFYNQNISTNEVLNFYKLLLNLNTLNYSKIEEFISTHKSTSKFQIKNAMGAAPSGFTEQDPTYMSYHLRMIDTDLKIMLSNEINAQRSTGTIDLSKIQNPYYKNPNHPFWSTDRKQICLDQPKFSHDEHTENNVCLILKLYDHIE